MPNAATIAGAAAVVGATLVVFFVMRSRSTASVESYLSSHGFTPGAKCPVEDPFGQPQLDVKTDNLRCFDGKLADGQAITLMLGATVGKYAGQYVGVYLPPGGEKKLDLASYKFPNKAVKTPDGGTLVIWWKRMLVNGDDVDAHIRELDQQR